jgi:hypothetical protein
MWKVYIWKAVRISYLLYGFFPGAGRIFGHAGAGLRDKNLDGLNSKTLLDGLAIFQAS